MYGELQNKIEQLAAKHGWEFIDWQKNIHLISFAKEEMRINVYMSKMTVGTCLNHPVQGKTQLFRKHVDMKLLDKLFQNPRQHTGKGYQKKK